MRDEQLGEPVDASTATVGGAAAVVGVAAAAGGAAASDVDHTWMYLREHTEAVDDDENTYDMFF